MISTIEESVFYERGYLKGFHDGRKWEENDNEISSHKDMIDRWNKFCKTHIPDDLPINEQWEKMKACWSVYEQDCPIEFRGDWKKLASSALASTANKLMSAEMSLQDAVELFHDIKSWLKMIK